VALPADEERGPRLVFADQTGSIQLADMSGDGLVDLVRIRNGEVCYWPNLGFGRFGAKVVMDGAPWFDRAELFDPQYLRLADVDGSGVTDLIYLDSDGARIWFNRSGNAWTGPHLVATAPGTDRRSQVAAVDLLGTGTTCLVWSSDRPVDARRSLRYLDLLGSVHPHLLVRVVNNLGAETEVSYAPSTRFYLADAAAGRPWLTRLPFPVQVVERVTTIDRVSPQPVRDPVRLPSRLFRRGGAGVPRVRDGGAVGHRAALGPGRGLGRLESGFAGAAGADPDLVPHRRVRRRRGMSRQFEAEYWTEPGLTGPQQQALLLADTPRPELLRRPDGTAVPHRPTGEELPEACRALKGRVLRQEIYAEDGTEAAGRPYQVTESNYTIELLQPRRDGDRHAVCHAYPRETVTYHYDRRLYPVDGPGGTRLLADPRVAHQATLEVDGYGNIVRAVTIGYGRRHPDADLDPRLPGWARAAARDAQTRTQATLTINGYTPPIDAGDHHRAPLPCESRSYQLVNLPDPGPAPARYPLAQLHALAEAASDGAHDLPHHDLDATGATGPAPWRRLVEHLRTRYLRDDLTGPLPPGQAEPLALIHQHYQLALTPDLITQVYRRPGGERLLPDPDPVLVAEGGYLADPDGWWIPSGQVTYDPDRFYLPTGLQDPFGNSTTLAYDPNHLLVRESRDPLGNRITAELDYRVLRPRLVADPNRNRSGGRVGLPEGRHRPEPEAVIGGAGRHRGPAAVGAVGRPG
jgi:YD repeat-containing protein